MPSLAPQPSMQTLAALTRLRTTREALYTSGRILGEDHTPRDLWPVGLTHDRGQALRDLVIHERATRCLETGFAYGLSASFLLEGSLTVQPESTPPTTQPRVASIDPFQSTQWRGTGRRFLSDAGLSHLHTLLESRSESALPQLIAEGQGGFDLAFIDGDHRFESAFLDIFFARRLLGPNKLIVVDDAWMPAIQKAAAFFTSASLCQRELTPEGSPLSKFILLRVDATGDSREWDHFEQF